MRQNTIESDLPGGERTNFANIFEKEENVPGVEQCAEAGQDRYNFQKKSVMSLVHIDFQ